MTRMTISGSSVRPRFGETILLGLALGGCQSTRQAAPAVAAAAAVTVEEEPANSWRRVASAKDIARLAAVQSAWSEGLDGARRGGFARRVAGEGDLLRPDGAQPRGLLPPGSYRCRVIRLGAVRPRGAAFSASAPFFCHVGAEEELLAFTKQTGPDRPGGYVYPDDDRRSVFIGASAVGRETLPPAYGARADRDVVGLVERIGPFRYRLVIPRPRGGGVLEVLELVPALPSEAPPRVARR